MAIARPGDEVRRFESRKELHRLARQVLPASISEVETVDHYSHRGSQVAVVPQACHKRGPATVNKGQT
jgi:hypothetical protein